jgi:hypothetical protein
MVHTATLGTPVDAAEVPQILQELQIMFMSGNQIMIVSYEQNNIVKPAFSGIPHFHLAQVHNPCDQVDKHYVHTTYEQDFITYFSSHLLMDKHNKRDKKLLIKTLKKCSMP